MTSRTLIVSVGIAATLGIPSVAAQHDQHQAGAQGSGASAAQVSQCVQAQPVVTNLLEASLKRIEDARLTNNAAAMRDAADDLQTALIDIRMQLAPCATMQAATDAHAGHVMPNVQQAPSAAPGTSAMQRGSFAPAPGAVKPSAPAPAGADPHAGHAAPATPQAPASRAPATAPARPAPGRAAAPAAADPHAGHATPAPAAPAARPRSAPAAPAATGGRPGAPAGHAGHGGAASPAAPATGTAAAPRPGLLPTPATALAFLKCRAPVEPKTAPRMLYQGRMYYFCSEQDRAAFARDPSKYALPAGEAAPAHGH